MTIGRLLGVACNPMPSEKQERLLGEAIRDMPDWDGLEPALSVHRLGPLLHWQIRHYGIDCPAPVRRVLAGMYAREKAITEVKTGFLLKLVERLDDQGIESVILKGGALAYLAYPEPHLRPREDLDILVAEAHLASVTDTLEQCGLRAEPPKNRYERLSHQWPIASGLVAGVPIHVEAHRWVLNARLGGYAGLTGLRRPLLAYTVDGRELKSLHPEEMLVTQLRRFRHLSDPFRAISLADLVGWAEYQGHGIDWPTLCRKHPSVRAAYRALQQVTPLGDDVCERLGLDPDTPTGGVDPTREHYRGWPLNCFGAHARARPTKGTLIRETLLPSTWWIRLAYGAAPGLGTWVARVVHHPANLVAQSARRAYMGRASEHRFFGRA